MTIERTTIDGRPAMVAYLGAGFVPTTREDATMIKVLFDDGDTMWLTPDRDTSKVWVEEDHPRHPAGTSEGGQFAPAGGGGTSGNGGDGRYVEEDDKNPMHEMFARIAKPDGGFTYQPVTHTEPKEGFALSIYPDRSFSIEADKLSEKHLVDYATKNADLFTSNADHYMGGWHDPATNVIYLDVSVVSRDRAVAERLARSHDQIAYFDLKAGKSIDVDRSATSGGKAPVSKAEDNAAKPTLHLLSGSKVLDVEALAAMYRRLTGKEMSEEGRAYAREQLSKLKKAVD